MFVAFSQKTLNVLNLQVFNHTKKQGKGILDCDYSINHKCITIKKGSITIHTIIPLKSHSIRPQQGSVGNSS